MATENTDNDDIFQEDDNNDINKKVVIDPIKVRFQNKICCIVLLFVLKSKIYHVRTGMQESIFLFYNFKTH